MDRLACGGRHFDDGEPVHSLATGVVRLDGELAARLWPALGWRGFRERVLPELRRAGLTRRFGRYEFGRLDRVEAFMAGEPEGRGQKGRGRVSGR